MTNNNIPIEKLFTGAKTPEYAVFYNIAMRGIENMIENCYKRYDKSHHNENEFKVLKCFMETVDNLENSKFSDLSYLNLRNYLWKRVIDEKNSSGSTITENDKKMIHKAINKLNDIRHFHSHYWHDNINLLFDDELKNWIDKLHLRALSILNKNYQIEVDHYKKNFKEKLNGELTFFRKTKDGGNYITQEGRNFFLCLFLVKGEITRFMQQRNGCKRNDKPEFKIKHEVYRFYARNKRAIENNVSMDKTAFSKLEPQFKNEILQVRQVYKMLCYLNDVPVDVIDTKLFPLYYKNEKIEKSTQLIGFLRDHQFLSQCIFSESKNEKKEIIEKELVLTYNNGNEEFKIKVKALLKIILDILRKQKKEEDIYNKLKEFINTRNEFLKDIDDFKNGNGGNIDKLNKHYKSHLKFSNNIRVKLGNMIDNFENKKNLKTNEVKDLRYLIEKTPIELTYHNFYFKEDQKPRSNNNFMLFAVHYLIDNGVVDNWEWLVEKFETENVRVEGKTQSEFKNVLKRKKEYLSTIKEGYRICLKNNHLLFRIKENPEIVFGIGQNAMRNLLILHFRNENKNNITDFINKVIEDLIRIEKASKSRKHLSFDQLKLLNNKTMPRYLKLMIRDPEVLQNETPDYAKSKTKKRINKLISDFELLRNKKLTRKEMNTQLLRWYKFYDWKYPKNNAYKFLRQNEYQNMSIYHYTLAKPNLTHDYLKDLRNTLFTSIKNHLPLQIEEVLNEVDTLEKLFIRMLDESIKILKKWNNRLNSMTSEQTKQVMSKLGIHIPISPIPDASIEINLKQMKNLPFMLHPALFFKSIGIEDNSKELVMHRNDDTSKGLIKQHYEYEPYLDLLKKSNNNQQNHTHKIIKTMNDLYLMDTFIWKMIKKYFNKEVLKSSKGLMKSFEEIIEQNSDNFQINKLKNFEFCVYEFKNIIHNGTINKIMIKFKQLDDFMLFEDKHLKKLTMQLFNRFTTEVELEKNGIKFENNIYEIPYELIKPEMDRIYHESVRITHFILDWEKNIIDKVSEKEKQNIIDRVKQKNNKQKAHINFDKVCKYASLSDKNIINQLKELRNHALHADIPDFNWTYKQKLNEDSIKNVLQITDEKLQQMQKKDAFFEVKS